MDLGDSGASEFSVSLESKERNKQAHKFFPSVSLVSCKCVFDTMAASLSNSGVPWING